MHYQRPIIARRAYSERYARIGEFARPFAVGIHCGKCEIASKELADYLGKGLAVSALVDGALSAPFTSEARALKRNAVSGYSCPFLGPARSRNRNRADRFSLPPLPARHEEASARIMSSRGSHGATDKRRIFRGLCYRGLLPFVIQRESTNLLIVARNSTGLACADSILYAKRNRYVFNS